MKNKGMIAAGALMSLVLAFTCSSCTKKGDALKGAKEEIQATTPERSERLAAVKKGIEESKKVLVARINGADITMYSLVKEMNAVAPDFVPAGKPATREITAKVKKKALDNLIFKELAVQEAIRQGMTVNPGAVEAVIIKVRTQAGSEEAYKKYLDERNLNEDTLRKAIERSHLFEMITAKEIFDKIKVQNKTVRDTYEKDRALFVTKESPPRQLSFEEAKGFLVRKIKSERSGKRIAEWDNELKKTAKIEVMTLKE